jgi:hypothetical protein
MNRLLAVVAVLLAIGIGVAFYLKWVNVSVAVDKDKMTNDLNKGKDLVEKEAKELKEKATSGLESVTGETILEGKVVTVDMDKKKVTIQGAKETTVVTVNDKTKIQGTDKKTVPLSDLKTGQVVSVRYGIKDQEHPAYNITEVTAK